MAVKGGQDSKPKDIIKITADDHTWEEMETRDKEIAELRNTLKNLSMSPKKTDLIPSPRNTLSPNDAMQRRRAASLQIEGRIQLQSLGELDFVPEHLVSPFLHQDRAKFKGPLQRVVHDDLVDMGVTAVTAGKHPSLVNRRRSDPGRVSPGLLQARLKYNMNMGPGSGNSSEDEDGHRSPRSLSPRPFITGVPEGEPHYPTSSLHTTDGRLSPGWASPRRRLSQPRHSTCGAYGGIGTVAGHESPRLRARKSRSNSLPMAVWPDKSALEVGEAIGALAMNNDKKNSPVDPHPSTAAQTPRCVSIEETPLEAILEETGTRAQSQRRFSVPHSISPSLYARAVAKPLKPFP